MQTSIPRPHILFIDGLPGSGKSMAARAVGGYLSHSQVFAETAQDHPLLVAAPDRCGLDRSVGRFVAVPDVKAPRSAGELPSPDRCTDQVGNGASYLRPSVVAAARVACDREVLAAKHDRALRMKACLLSFGFSLFLQPQNMCA